MSTVSSTNATRWADISAKYEQILRKNGDESFQMGRFAIHLRKALADACGCAEEMITHHHYEYGYVPENDVSRKASNGFASVSSSEHGWTFGLGVRLEVGPNTYPKTDAVFPVTVQLGDILIVESAMFDGKAEVDVGAGKYNRDLQALAERMYQGLVSTLDLWASGEKPSSRIGFNAG